MAIFLFSLLIAALGIPLGLFCVAIYRIASAQREAVRPSPINRTNGGRFVS